MVNGRFDLQAPIAWAWDLNRVWPRSELVVVDNAGHAVDSPGVTQELVRSTDQFATLR
jgi:proline iminopeptidase